MVDIKNILLSPDELKRCDEFSQRSAPNQQDIEFGQHSTQKRRISEIARDNLIGKIAEVAFSKMMEENYGITVPLDFNYYPRGKWDSQDAVINGWRIDIKATRMGGHWMLIEWNKLNFRQRENNLSHVYVMFSVGWDRTTDKPTGIVCYEGAASLSKLNKNQPCTRVLRKGDFLPGTQTTLQADNYGIKFDDLHSEPEEFVHWLQKHSPPESMVLKYPNPYTNETTENILLQENPRLEDIRNDFHNEEDQPVKMGYFTGIISFLKKTFTFK